jgi:hypothetical protein
VLSNSFEYKANHRDNNYWLSCGRLLNNNVFLALAAKARRANWIAKQDAKALADAELRSAAHSTRKEESQARATAIRLKYGMLEDSAGDVVEVDKEKA